MSVIVLDGMRLSSDYAGELESLVRARDLAGVEVYRGIQAPAEFADLRGVRHGRLLDQAAQRERPGGR